MGTSPVRPEFGPTLPEVLGRRFGWSVRTVGLVAAGMLVLIVAGGVAKKAQGDGSVRIVVPAAVPFNLRYDPAKLDRVTPQGAESLRLVTKAGDPNPSSVTVAPARLAAYVGDDPSVALPIFAGLEIARMQRGDPKFVLRGEGRARVNSQPGYQIQYLTQLGGRVMYGRRVFLFPDPRDTPGAREGGDVTLLAARSKVVTNPDDVGSNGVTKLPYRSFRLGTKTP